MGAGMMGAGMGANFVAGQLQGWASLIDKWAMADAYKAELARQNQYGAQAMGTFQAQLPQAGAAGATAQLADAAKTRTADYGATMATPLGFDLPYQRSASSARDVAANQMSASQRANLQKYGDWMFNQKMNNLATGRTLDQITNFAAGTSRVFPYRMYDAQHAGDALAEIGAAIGAINSGAQGVRASFGGGPPSSGGYGTGTFNPYGQVGQMYGLPSYSDMNSFTDVYGNYYPQGWNTYGGSNIPG